MPALLVHRSPALNNLVDAALRRSPYFAHRAVRFETAEGRVVLRGTVGSYYHKQMAQEILRRCADVVSTRSRTSSKSTGPRPLLGNPASQRGRRQIDCGYSASGTTWHRATSGGGQLQIGQWSELAGGPGGQTPETGSPGRRSISGMASGAPSSCAPLSVILQIGDVLGSVSGATINVAPGNSRGLFDERGCPGEGNAVLWRRTGQLAAIDLQRKSSGGLSTFSDRDLKDRRPAEQPRGGRSHRTMARVQRIERAGKNHAEARGVLQLPPAGMP